MSVKNFKKKAIHNKRMLFANYTSEKDFFPIGKVLLWLDKKKMR